MEVFYGKGLPSVLGQHPVDGSYRLEGHLSPAPEWLLEWLTPRKKKVQAKAEAATEDGAPPTAVDPVVFDALIEDLIALEPKLGWCSVAWKQKEIADGRILWLGQCPFEHASGRSSQGDLSAGFGADGNPYIHCMHGSCEAIPEINRRLRDRHAHRKPGVDLGPLVPIEPTPIASRMVEDLAARRIALHIAPTGSGKSFSAAQAAAVRCRQGLRTVIAAPTVRMCR